MNTTFGRRDAGAASAENARPSNGQTSSPAKRCRIMGAIPCCRGATELCEQAQNAHRAWRRVWFTQHNRTNRQFQQDAGLIGIPFGTGPLPPLPVGLLAKFTTAVTFAGHRIGLV